MGGLRLVATFGWLLGIEAFAAAVTGIVTLAEDTPGPSFVFFATAGTMGFIAAGLVLAFGGRAAPSRGRHGLAFVLAAWTLLPAFAALPFVAIAGTTWLSGYFEAVSVFTTTGATALGSIDALPRSLVIWRALLEWLGGALTIVMAAAALDYRRGAEHGSIILMSSSVANVPRLVTSARQVLPLYAGLTLLCGVILAVAGVSSLDAICLAFSTMSTGGAMPIDGDISDYGVPAMVPILCIFMIFGAINLMTLRGAHTHYRLPPVATRPVVSMALIAGLIAVTLSGVFFTNGEQDGAGLGAAVVEGAFTTVSLITTTAFVHDRDVVAGVPLGLMLCVLLVGGAYGSSAGGLKVSRVFRMLSATGRELDVLVHPSSISAGRRLHEDGSEPQRILWSYFIAFLLAVALVSLVLAGAGLEFEDALVGAAGVIANAGPALDMARPDLAPGAGYAGLSDGVKTVLALAMVVGRVEVLAVLCLVTPLFWRR